MLPTPAPSPPIASRQPYPSPRSKSPPASQFKSLRNLPNLKCSLTAVTTAALVDDDDVYPLSQKGKAVEDALPRRGRGRNRRGRTRGRHAHDRANSHTPERLRSPIPLSCMSRDSSSSSPKLRAPGSRHKFAPASPILSPTSPPRDTLKRRCPSFSTVKPETPRHTHKRPQCLPSSPLYGDPPSPPLTPALINPRFDRTRAHVVRSPSPPLHFPMVPSHLPTVSINPNIKMQLALLGPMNLGLGLAPMRQQVRKRHTKRELADLHWQIVVHRSLAWMAAQKDATRMPKADESEGAEIGMTCPYSQRAMDFAQGGLMLTLVQPPRACDTLQLSWTSALDRELLSRLGAKLSAEGYSPLPTPFMPRTGTVNPLQNIVPFPLGQFEDSLPFSPQSAPGPDDLPQSLPCIAPRRRVCSMASAFQPCSPTQFPATPSTPCSVSCSLTPSDCHNSEAVPDGTLTPTQLVAQAIFRRGKIRTKSIKRFRPPGLSVPRPSGLRHEARLA
ncbi:hypothetical protein K439DRAFT_676747 [Ramaria rubella]|nr:hypothetical protein K439DRAFT_676747 [Ramaria rubella]